MLLLGAMTMLRVLGPTPDQSVFHTFWWYTQEAGADYSIIGCGAIVAGLFFNYFFQLITILLVSLPALLAGLAFIFQSRFAYQVNFSTGDALLHLVQGIGIILVLDELFLRQRG